MKQHPAFIVLKPSSIEGIGAFTVEPIKAGEEIHLGEEDARFIPDHEFIEANLWLYDRWCVKTKDGWWCPQDFQRMSVGWYMNHSEQPNITYDEPTDTYRANRDIAADEELTVDYRTLDSHEDNYVLREGIKMPPATQGRSN